MAAKATIHAFLARRCGIIKASKKPDGLLRPLPNRSKLLIKLGNLATRIDHTLHPGPSRMRFRVNIQSQRIAGLAHAGHGFEFRPIGHDDINFVVFRVDIRPHGGSSMQNNTADPDRQQKVPAFTR